MLCVVVGLQLCVGARACACVCACVRACVPAHASVCVYCRFTDTCSPVPGLRFLICAAPYPMVLPPTQITSVIFGCPLLAAPNKIENLKNLR